MLEQCKAILTGNAVLVLAVLAWFSAQVLKVIVNLCVQQSFDLHLLLSAGGMPSSHSALVCACAVSIGRMNGFRGTTFALACVLALVVMYDACNVRRAAGEQARVLNYIVENWENMSPEVMGRKLKELLGHTPLQVVMGAILGILIGWFGVEFWL